MGIPYRLTHHDQTTDPIVQNVPTKISLKRTGHGIRLINKDASAMQISFNFGQNSYPIASGAEFVMDDIQFHFFVLTSTQASPSWFAVIKEG